MAADKIQVAVRVRPFNKREIDLDTSSVVEMVGNQTILKSPSHVDKADSSSGGGRPARRAFAFDHCFDSTCADTVAASVASQQEVFASLGSDILHNAFTGYNACIFAYGQTGSGKSYTMMGSGAAPGLIPRLCDTLFERVHASTDPGLNHKVEVSYMEIYNEKVHDLLDPRGGKQSLKVREHNLLGPYVDGLSTLAVTSEQDIERLIVEGNKSRTVAATNMNSESSRSHAVFTVILTQTLTDVQSGVSGEKVSRISLVDLAGSERAVKTGAAGHRLKEGSNINKSLTTLGLVISKLADASAGKARTKDNFVPYRDSVLTWLLKDNLGGNSRTVMVATISPASDNYEETLSTLRYADRAKRIVNHAVVNEDPNARIIRELRQEVETLRTQLARLKSAEVIEDYESPAGLNLREKLTENEKIMRQMSETWEEKLQKTDRLQQQRQQALEKMGISVQSVGIAVQKNKFYLVNLNADPSLNEMLVYYLKEHTVVGRPDAPGGSDIQLSGLGIQPEHCRLTVERDAALCMTPVDGARCCVNGFQVTARVPLHHGDRLLWGNNHFFRVNCPRPEPRDGADASTATAGGGTAEPQTPAHQLDYEFARQELVMNELSNNPIQAAIQRMEQHHEQDKQMALEQQRRQYERQFEQLRSAVSPSTPGTLLPLNSGWDGLRRAAPLYTPLAQARIDQWVHDREDQFRRSVTVLRQEIGRANSLAREASSMADELGRATSYTVTLQIPPENLGPNRKRPGLFVCEPAILVKRRGHPNQIWSMEKLDNKLVDMRELYNGIQSGGGLQDTLGDPFFETQENHHLIGVASLYLEALLHDVPLQYQVPVISQQGEVAGRLQMELERVAGGFQDRMADSTSNPSADDSARSDEELFSNTVTCRLTIRQASGLPPSLAHFVFCQYNFWGCSQTQVCPPVGPAGGGGGGGGGGGAGGGSDGVVVQFDHCRDFVIPVCEEFVEHCSEGALSVEVWGHRSAGFSSSVPTITQVVDSQRAKARSLADRWSELTRKLQLWVELHELNDQGEYQPVEVAAGGDVLCGGVYQLRQGQQRRVAVRLTPVAGSGTLPLLCHSITGVTVGSVTCRSRLQKPLDSYQEEDLNQLRERWSGALVRRRQYLDSHLQRIIRKQDKTEADNEREKSLLDQWIRLNEERNAVLVPAAGSGVPGSPLSAGRMPARPGLESHVPVLFLNLNEEMRDDPALQEGVGCAGEHCLLPKEHAELQVALPVVRAQDGADASAVAQWDSSVHESVHLNRVTPANERVYLVVTVRVQLCQPLPMEMMLRKRLCVNVYKPSFANRLMRSIALRRGDQPDATGVVYEVVSNIPKASEELEDRESLAQIAANADQETGLAAGDTYIEKYLQGVGAVESILRLDRLRQSVAVRERLRQAAGSQLRGSGLGSGLGSAGAAMRKTASVPNISYFQLSERSESAYDLNGSWSAAEGAPLGGPPPPATPAGRPASRPTFLNLSSSPGGGAPAPGRLQGAMSKCRSLLSGLSGSLLTLHEAGAEPTPPTPTPAPAPPPLPPLASSSSSSSHVAPSPGGGGLRLSALRMSTLHEDHDRERSPERDSPPPHAHQPAQGAALWRPRWSAGAAMRSSRTFDSLVEIPAAGGGGKPATGSPSVGSSGYGSQAVSSSNLCSDDTLSLQSADGAAEPEGATAPAAAPPSQQRQPAPAAARQSLRPASPDNKHPQDSSAAQASCEAASLEIAQPSTTGDSVALSHSTEEPVVQHLETAEDVDEEEQGVSGEREWNVGETRDLEVDDGKGEGGEAEDARIERPVALENRGESEETGERETRLMENDRGVREEAEDERGENEKAEDETRLREVAEDDRGVKEETEDERGDNEEGVDETRLREETQDDRRLREETPDDRREGEEGEDVPDQSQQEEERKTAYFNLDAGAAFGLPEWVRRGQPVLLRPQSSSGHIRFVGPVKFAPGCWCGVELDLPQGKNDGWVRDVHYFECGPRHGVFVRADKLIWDHRRSRAARGGGRPPAPAAAAARRSASRGELAAVAAPGRAGSRQDGK